MNRFARLRCVRRPVLSRDPRPAEGPVTTWPPLARRVAEKNLSEHVDLLGKQAQLACHGLAPHQEGLGSQPRGRLWPRHARTRMSQPGKRPRTHPEVAGRLRALRQDQCQWRRGILSGLIKQMALISDFMDVSTSRLLNNSETSFHDVGG
jgi:hypothetical protein